MEKTILTQLTENELRDLVKNSVTQSLKENQQKENKGYENFFSLKEASSYLHLATQTLYGFTSQRTIPFIKKGKKLLFKKSDLDKWLNEGRKKTIKEMNSDSSKKEKGGNNE